MSSEVTKRKNGFHVYVTAPCTGCGHSPSISIVTNQDIGVITRDCPRCSTPVTYMWG